MPENRLILRLASLFFILGSGLVHAAPAMHPGEHLIRDNNCAACHQIGALPASRPAPKAGPSYRHIGQRIRPQWLMGFLMKPRKLRPAIKSRMPDFRFSPWEAIALIAYLMELRSPWPRPPTEKETKDKEEEKPVGFEEVYLSLQGGNAKRGRKIFADMDCAKCHGDPKKGTRPAEGDPKDWGPDLREMSRKLTREGIAAILFSPRQIYPETKMPSFFYDQGEPQDENAAQQMADLTAYILSLRGEATPDDGKFRRGKKQHPKATVEWGKRIAWQLNCSGCHTETGLSPRDPGRMAVSFGYRNAPRFYTRELLASWIKNPATIHMHERMHGLGRMPTFGFSLKEARQITDWLFSFDGPPGRRGSGMLMWEFRRQRDRGPGQMR